MAKCEREAKRVRVRRRVEEGVVRWLEGWGDVGVEERYRDGQ